MASGLLEMNSWQIGETASPALSKALFGKTVSEAVRLMMNYLNLINALLWSLADLIWNDHCCKINVLEQIVWQRSSRAVKLMDHNVIELWIAFQQRRFLAPELTENGLAGVQALRTHCCWVDTLAKLRAPTIRWLLLRFCEGSATCYHNISPAGSWWWWGPPQSTTTYLDLHCMFL